jgi:hypothetical protein
MKNSRLKVNRVIIISAGIILLLALLIIVFISPITKHLIEKNDEKWTGRQITLDRAYVNPFTGYVSFSNVKFYEPQSDSIFLSVGNLSGTFNLLDIFHGQYIINELTLDHPVGNIIEDKKIFNFDSFIRFITPEHPDTTHRPSNFNILKIKIKDGEFHYLQKEIPVTYFIRNADIESDGQLWDADSVTFKFHFLSGPSSGSIQGTYTVNFKSNDYHYSIVVHDFDLTPIQQYLKDIANYGTFRAKLEADLQSVGNFSDAQNVRTTGQLTVLDFHFGKNPKEDYAAFDKLKLAIHEVAPMNQIYFLDSMILSRPRFKYEQYDHFDNVQAMFAKNGGNIEVSESDPDRFNLIIEIAHYIKILSQDFFHSFYRINRLSIEDADFLYNDYSPAEKFFIAATPLDITADSIDKRNESVEMQLKSGIKPFGNFSIAVKIKPADSSTFDLHYQFQKIPATLFNPYLISYTSYPLDRGTIESYGSWKVKLGIINSDNHVVIVDPRVTKRIKNKDTHWIPLPLVMSFVREYGNVIDYEIPITGNMKNPKFHLHDVIMDILKNIFVKPPTTPYRMEVKTLENQIENYLSIKWRTGKSDLTKEEKKFITEMADYLHDNPSSSIVITPVLFTEKEKEHLLFFEAKKKYFLAVNKDKELLTESDSAEIDKMSIKDSSFIRYLEKHVHDKMLFTTQEKCSRIVDAQKVNVALNNLKKQRAETFLSIFKKKGVDQQIRIMNSESAVPYNGFSFYKINYPDKVPESLSDAYRKLNELNVEVPRKKFLKERKMTMTPSLSQ